MKPKLSGKSSSPGISQNLGSLKMKGLGKNNTMFSAGKSVNDEDDCITRHQVEEMILNNIVSI